MIGTTHLLYGHPTQVQFQFYQQNQRNLNKHLGLSELQMNLQKRMSQLQNLGSKFLRCFKLEKQI